MKTEIRNFKKAITLFILTAALLLFVAPLHMQAVSGPTVVAVKQQETDISQSETLTKREHRQLSRIAKRQAKKNVFEILSSPSDPNAFNGFAIAGFVCAVVGLIVAGIILGALGIIFSAIALKRIREGRGGSRGRGLAIAGLVIGIVAVVGAIFII